MRILAVHNYYRLRGGEDGVYESETQLLERRGHDVFRYVENNDEIDRIPRHQLLLDTIYRRHTYRNVREQLDRLNIDLVHCHNTMPRISPSVYFAANDSDVPVVQTLHNYRLTCLNALLLRSGSECEACLGRMIPWPGVKYRCYRGSYTESAALASMLSFHNIVRTWNRRVSRFVALTSFAKEVFVRAGIDSAKIVVKPNALNDDPGLGSHSGGYALFVGRLSPEKGISTMLKAWRSCQRIPLRIVGDGPLREEGERAAMGISEIEFLGQVDRSRVYELMKEASVLIFPSECYEGFPLTIAEAFATGLPVIASDYGSMRTIIDSGKTGLLFQKGDPESLAAAVRKYYFDDQLAEVMSSLCRTEYESKYTDDANYRSLASIYNSVLRETL